FGTFERTLRMKWTGQRCQLAPANTVSIAEISPVCASLMTSFTPPSPRALSERRKLVQNGCDSVSPTSNPRTSRRPSAATPIATTTAWETTRRPTLALQYVEARNTYGYVVSGRDRTRNEATDRSKFPELRGTTDYIMPER